MKLCRGRARVGVVVAAALSAALVLGACGGGADRAAAPVESELAFSEAAPEADAGTSEDSIEEASETPAEVLPSEAPSDQGPAGPVGISQTTYVKVENRLQDWWGGDGIPITWRVSETQNRYWDGASRPDKAPPKGLQGLVQDANSGPYRVRLEVNSFYYGRKSFVLTPVASIDRELVALSPITFADEEFNTYSGWNLLTGGLLCSVDAPVKDQTQVQSFTYRTPRGDLAYDVVLKCPETVAGAAEVLIRNYQRQ